MQNSHRQVETGGIAKWLASQTWMEKGTGSNPGGDSEI